VRLRLRKPLDAEPSPCGGLEKERTNSGRFGLLAVENSRTLKCAVAIAMSWNSVFLDVTLAGSMRFCGRDGKADGSTAVVIDGLVAVWES
jgi:hypothetical protein